MSACWLSDAWSKKGAVGYRVIIGHEGANKLTLVDSKRIRLNQITIGRNTTSAGLKLGNEGVTLGATRAASSR
jgi:hypothetical protein